MVGPYLELWNTDNRSHTWALIVEVFQMCFPSDSPRTGSVIPHSVNLGKWAMFLDSYPNLHGSPFLLRKKKKKKREPEKLGKIKTHGYSKILLHQNCYLLSQHYEKLNQHLTLYLIILTYHHIKFWLLLFNYFYVLQNDYMTITCDLLSLNSDSLCP